MSKQSNNKKKNKVVYGRKPPRTIAVTVKQGRYREILMVDDFTK